jgi:hypothetical protein
MHGRYHYFQVEMTVTLFKKGITDRKADPKKIISEKKRNMYKQDD